MLLQGIIKENDVKKVETKCKILRYIYQISLSTRKRASLTALHIKLKLKIKTTIEISGHRITSPDISTFNYKTLNV
jgi:hypothetical protein